jgi:hypothetical protein
VTSSYSVDVILLLGFLFANLGGFPRHVARKIYLLQFLLRPIHSL